MLDPGTELPSDGCSTRSPARDPVRGRLTLEPGARAALDILWPVRARSPRGIGRRRPGADRRREESRAASFAAREVALARRCGACCRTRRRSLPALSDDEIERRYPDRAHEERVDGALVSFFTPDGAHNRHVVLRAKERLVARRHGTFAAQRPAACCRTRRRCRHLLDARRVRRAAHDRQYLVPQAVLGLARSLQHHALERAADPGRPGERLAAARRAVRLRNRPQRLPLDLSPARTGPSPCMPSPRATSRRMHWRVTVEASLAGSSSSAISSSASASSIIPAASRSTRRASASPSAPIRRRSGDGAIPRPSIISSPRTPDAVEAIGGDELLYADGAARRRRLRGDADAADERASLRGGRLADRSPSAQTPRGKI